MRRIAVLLLVAASSLNAQSPFASAKWRSIGPVNTSGRIDDIAVARVKGEADAIYVATASSGVWKSSNNGISWSPVFDGVDAMMSIGAIAVAPSAQQTVWIGTGEANTRQSSSWGDGVYKSTDGGKTWTNMGLKDTRSVARVVIDPADANVVYIAAQGHLWGPNAERGVFKTTDGGRTWKKALFINENTGATDLVIDPSNPNILYAATYQRQRRTWGFNGGGPGSAIHKTTDGGLTWTKLTGGLPAGDKGRIGLAIFAGDPRILYATIEARGGESGVYRTMDGGANWVKVSALNTRPNYYSQIRVDARDHNRIYTLGSNRGFYFSNDGGRTFIDRFSSVHGEDHALWLDPDNSNHLIIGGDGGVSLTWDRGTTWDFRRNMPLGQFYEIDVDNSVPFRICGGLQDNGVWCMPSAVRNRNGIADRDAWNIGGGDGFHAVFDPTDNNMVLQSSQNGNAAWVNVETLERRGARPGSGDRPAAGGGRGGRGGGGAAAPAGGRGEAAGANEEGGPPAGGYRWNWDTPFIVSKHDPKVWYMAAQVLFKSTDRGGSWTKISDDLTLNANRDTLKMMGAVVPGDALSRHDGQSNYGSVTMIAESPMNAQVIYTGADDGSIRLTKDGGKTWSKLTVTGVPDQTYVSGIVASKFVAGRVYVTHDGHYTDDYKPYVSVSDDFGATWKSIINGLPAETGVNRIREHPKKANVLVVAHERGLHASNDGGTTWHSLGGANMPTVSVDDIVFQERDNALVAGTHGRGIWVLDEAGIIEALTADALRADIALIPSPRARLMSTSSPQAWYGHGEFFAPNPDWNGQIVYNLANAGAGADITITDAMGKAIRTLKGPAAKGMNRVVWDLRYQPPIDSAAEAAAAAGGGAGGRGGRGGGGGRGGEAPALTQVGYPAGGGGGGGRGGGAAQGPLVMPGNYTVKVTVGSSKPVTGTLIVDADPLPRFTAADRAARQAILMRVYDWGKTLGEARSSVRALTSQSSTMKTDLGATADSLNARASRLSGEIDRALAAVNGQRQPIEAWSGLPSADQKKSLGYALEDATKVVAELNKLVNTDLPAAYKAAGKTWGARVKGVTAPVASKAP